MFRSSKRQAFTPTAYGSSRRKRRVPRWLVLILTGIVLGVGGLLFLQTSYGPTRLTVEQSEQLHYDLNSANMDKQRLQSDLAQQERELVQLRAQLQAQSNELDSARAELETVKEDIFRFADAMPPDPRGTSPGVNSALFTYDEGAEALHYSLLIMQDKDKADKPFKGSVRFSITGRYPNGRTGTVELPAIDLNLERYVHVDGSAPLPDRLSPRQVTVDVLNADGRQVATRILNVR
jgi:ribosomal protein L29